MCNFKNYISTCDWVNTSAVRYNLNVFLNNYRQNSFHQIYKITSIAAGGAVISYALYTISERTVSLFKTEALIYTTVFVLYGIFRYMYLIYQKKSGENPTDVILGDIGIIANIFLWLIACIVIIYRWQILKFLGIEF